MITKIKAVVKDFFKIPTYEEDCMEAIRTLEDAENDVRKAEKYFRVTQEEDRKRRGQQENRRLNEIIEEITSNPKPAITHEGKLHLPENAMHDAPAWARYIHIQNESALQEKLFQSLMSHPYFPITADIAKDLSNSMLVIFKKHMGE